MTGIICVNKPNGITSFSAVSQVRRITGEKKAGHTGTLDPMATGVLPVMLGGATRFLDFIPDSDKAYRAGFSLGITTDTLDITGTVTGRRTVCADESDVRAVLKKFTGVISQVVPMYSAASVGGRRFYELARSGVEVERPVKQVEIKELTLESAGGNDYIIDVVCTKGTYIRTLIDDIGKELGCGAVMTSLQRTAAMGFYLDSCLTIEELQAARDGGKIRDALIGIEKVLEVYKAISVSQAQAKRFFNGGALALDRLKFTPENGLYRVYSPDGIFLGLGECSAERGELSVKRILSKRD